MDLFGDMLQATVVHAANAINTDYQIEKQA